MIPALAKSLALCGLSLLLAGAASAQTYSRTYHHPAPHSARAIQRQKAIYARAVAHGNYARAERAHLRAKAIRHHTRTRRAMHRDYRH